MTNNFMNKDFILGCLQSFTIPDDLDQSNPLIEITLDISNNNDTLFYLTLPFLTDGAYSRLSADLFNGFSKIMKLTLAPIISRIFRLRYSAV